MPCDNGIRMYLVSDLLRQYNEKHGTNKLFKNYLQNKQTQELLRKRCEKTDRGNCHDQAKSVRENSPVRSEGENSAKNGQSTGGPNSDHLSNEGQEGQSTVGLEFQPTVKRGTRG